jgi:next to BRCA1 gene 1 protein
LLAIPPEQQVRFDRFSDSAGTYVTLDSNNPAIYKQLYRAAKAKLKLRLRATVERAPAQTEPAKEMDSKKPAEPRNNFLETVLSQPTANATASTAPLSKSFQKTCSYSPKCAIPGAFDLDLGNSQQSTKAPATGSADVYSLPTLPSMSDFPSTSYTIDCNACGSSVPNEHYHCGICEGGDFDLCKACIDAGVTCDGEEHWLLKRTIRNGAVIPSTTQTLPPKKGVPDAPYEGETVQKNCRIMGKEEYAQWQKDTELHEKIAAASAATRPEQDCDDLTCNSCICRKYHPRVLTTCGTNNFVEMPAKDFVTCRECPDYDLCISCFHDGEHGHNPAHSFTTQDPEASKDDPTLEYLCAPGRGVRHDAICDGCDEVSLFVSLCTHMVLTGVLRASMEFVTNASAAPILITAPTALAMPIRSMLATASPLSSLPSRPFAP